MGEVITISKEEYDEMMERLDWLDCLEMAGVDNWDGCSYAADLRREQRPDLDELDPEDEEYIEEYIEDTNEG